MATASSRKKNTLLRALFAGFAILLSLSATSRAGGSWFDEAWTARKKVTVDTTQTGVGITEPIGPATVLIRLFEGNFSFATAKEDLSDLRFVAEDDKTLLPYHIEKMDLLMGEAYVWVKLPDVTANGKTSFWIYHTTTDPKATKVEDAKASYDGDTVLVLHFAENGPPPTDATKNSNVALAPATRAEGSMIGSGVTFNGKTNITIPASPSLLWAVNTPMTLSIWVKSSALGENAEIFSRHEGAASFILGENSGVPFVEISGQRVAATTPPFPVNVWHHLAVVCEAGKTTLYVNGEAAVALGSPLPGANGSIVLGGDANYAATPFAGEMDELQMSRVARPVGQVQLVAFGQGGEKATKLCVFGEDEEKKNWMSWLTTGYFGVIIKNLTVDGWVVICILAVMAVISWYVMVTKMSYLNGVSKGNEMFMKQWRHVASDLTVLDDEDHEKAKTLGGRVDKSGMKKMRKSSVFRIYHIGVDEIRHRLTEDRSQGVRRGLAGRSIQAIRASLDGGLVHETQKLNKLIVLLTICISGGPFLGLLGTVVGVMITFAAVAAAGEVNVNAIAPGIAAALLATVAGLAVAIPALFGYNYILSRVKDAKDDMHVFIDEFVTRMAEFHKESNS